MSGNYEKIVRNNLSILFQKGIADLASRLPALHQENQLEFRAFGNPCLLFPDRILINGEEETGVLGILITLYAIHADFRECRVEPLKAFKELPNSAPYAGAFSVRAQQILVPHVDSIQKHQDKVMERFGSESKPSSAGGDFSFILYPLPKIALCYIFHLADDDFQASATCLFSNNATSFAPIDALADTAEYTSKEILRIISRI
ncbi:MAG: DUF3786 domain-containing protein [Thermodesulfobacteriota bacterium]